MSWLDKLKHLIKIDINWNAPLFAVNITKNSNNKINFDKEYFFDQENKVLHLALDKLPPEILEKIPEIPQQYIEDGNRLLEKKSDSLLENLYKYNKEDNKDKSILSFFKPIIPFSDLEALEASLFLRYKFSQDRCIHNLKSDIRKRFGDRGNNIANLVTAGYIEGFLMLLYNDSQETFKKVYDDVVGKSIVAVFVHRGMEPTEITSQISKRIEISKKYGIRFIHIHGISKSNVEKIKLCIEENKQYFDFFEKKIYENEEKDILVVELLFK